MIGFVRRLLAVVLCLPVVLIFGFLAFMDYLFSGSGHEAMETGFNLLDWIEGQ